MKNLFLLILIFPLTSCGKSELNWLILSPNNIEGLTNLKFLLSGLTTTIYISIVSIIISIILGLLVAIPSLAKSKFLTYLNIGYVEIVRAIPLLVLILWIYYGLPIMTGISFSPFVSGIIALSISESAFQAEIFRAGINSIKKSQWEAGSSLGLSFFRKLRLVILPQAIKNILPAIGNQFVYVLKMSSLVSIIGIGDLTRKANELVVTTYRPLEIYTFLILEYLVLILVVSYLVRKLEKRLDSSNIETVDRSIKIKKAVDQLNNLSSEIGKFGENIKKDHPDAEKLMSKLSNIASSIEKIKEDQIEPDFVSALKLCKRRRIGPIRPESNRELFYKKDMGILARGGFSFDLSKRVLELETEEFNKLIKLI